MANDDEEDVCAITLGERVFHAKRSLLHAHLLRFQNFPALLETGYRVTSDVSPEALALFLDHVEHSDSQPIPDEYSKELKILWEEFGYKQLEKQLDATQSSLRGALSVQSMMLRHQFYRQMEMLQGKDVDAACHLTTTIGTPFSEYQWRLKELLQQSPNQSIAIPPLRRLRHVTHAGVVRRIHKTKYIYKTPLFYTCWRLVNHQLVKHFVTLLLLVNMGMNVYMSFVAESAHPRTFEVLRNVEMAFSAVFVVEIVVQIIGRGAWFLDFYFIMDFLLVIATFPSPGFVAMVSTARLDDLEMVQENTKVLWVFAALKCFRVVPRVAALRNVVHNLRGALGQFFYLGVMIVMFMYVFAVFGMYAFYEYTISDDPELIYQSKFASLPDAFITMFQILTIDSWVNMMLDISRVCWPVMTYAYIILWMWIGAYIFANVFIAILVNNIKESSRRGLKFEKRTKKARKRAEEKREYIRREKKKGRRRKGEIKFDGTLQITGRDMAERLRHIFARFEPLARKCGTGARDVISNIQNMGKDYETIWTRAEITEYFRLLVQLSDSLTYGDELEKLLSQVLFKCIESKHDDIT